MSDSGFRERSIGYQVNRLARLLAFALRDRIAELGVVPGQFAQLLALYEEDGITQAQLCARVDIEQPTMANTLTRMERDGLVQRVPDPRDKRRSLVLLTPRARAMEDDLLAAAQAINDAATRGLDAADVLATTSQMIANLEALRLQGSAVDARQ